MVAKQHILSYTFSCLQSCYVWAASAWLCNYDNMGSTHPCNFFSSVTRDITWLLSNIFYYILSAACSVPVSKRRLFSPATMAARFPPIPASHRPWLHNSCPVRSTNHHGNVAYQPLRLPPWTDQSKNNDFLDLYRRDHTFCRISSRLWTIQSTAVNNWHDTCADTQRHLCVKPVTIHVQQYTYTRNCGVHNSIDVHCLYDH